MVVNLSFYKKLRISTKPIATKCTIINMLLLQYFYYNLKKFLISVLLKIKKKLLKKDKNHNDILNLIKQLKYQKVIRQTTIAAR